MSRPIERVRIADQCARCFRRRLAGELLCRTHLHLKQREADVAREQRHPLVHQDVGRVDEAGHSEGAPAVDRRANEPKRALPTHLMNREEYRQARQAASFGSSVLVPVLDKTCPHKEGDWCVWCEDAASYDDGEPT